MSNKEQGSGTTSAGGGGGGGGGLSLMGCVREASPPPQTNHPFTLATIQHNADVIPKEPKKRRFHPLRGLRRIFRRKSRSVADSRLHTRTGDNDSISRDREEISLTHPAGRNDEVRSQSASELLTDSCDHQSVFLRREESFPKLRGASGLLSVSHDSVFPGEVSHTRPLSSLDALPTLERRPDKVSDDAIHKTYGGVGAYGSNNRMSQRVFEQIKTAIENRNQLTSASESSHTVHNRFGRSSDKRRIEDDEEKLLVSRTSHHHHQQQQYINERISTPKEDLPELESDSLNHTAAHHRISVRPKNRRPPRRSNLNTSSMSGSTITTISETSSDALDSLEPISTSNVTSTSVDNKTNSIIRKSSNQNLRSSDIFEELECKLPKKSSSSLASLSPDSLDFSCSKLVLDNQQNQINENDGNDDVKNLSRQMSKGSDIFDELEEKVPKKRQLSINRLSKSPDSLDNSYLSKSIDTFDKINQYDDIDNNDIINDNVNDNDVNDNDNINTRSIGWMKNSISNSSDGFASDKNIDIKTAIRRHSNTVSKSTDSFDKLMDYEQSRPTGRGLVFSASKIPDIINKSSDSLELLDNAKNISDDSIERRRSSFEIRPRRTLKVMSMSSENFDAFEKPGLLEKRSSASDVHLARLKKQIKTVNNNKMISKSIESFETIESHCQSLQNNKNNINNINNNNNNNNRFSLDLGKQNWRTSKRISSESSDNVELDDNNKIENRKVNRKPPSSTLVDIFSSENNYDDTDKRLSTPVRKPSRLQSSESSELGSTDRSSDSIDSIDKDEEIFHRNNKSFKNDSIIDVEENKDNADGINESKSILSGDKSYWRQTSDSKENIDIHQLLALTLVSRVSDNGNNQRNFVTFPKKKLTPSPPSSPAVHQDDNKLLFNNLLSNNKNPDEEFQNMLNGNISEVSTDTKSFKEKLIMFEKLGK